MTKGVFVGEEETYVLQLGQWEIMQEYINGKLWFHRIF